jgi:hypothetical protein
MPIRDQDIADLLVTTLNTIRKERFIDMSQELTEYIVVPYLLTQRGGLVVKKGGVGLEETLMIEHGGRSRFVGEYDEDVIVVIDHLKKMKLFYSLLTDNLAYTRSEILDNRGKERINNIIKPRRRAMYMRIAETMEENFFQTPDADDSLTPWGLRYWIVKNATAGFNGGYPAGFTRIGDINLTEVPQFKNYTDTYVAISKADLILKMRRAHRRTNWRSPRKDPGVEGNTSPRRLLLTCEDVLEGVENIGEAQNENLGRDVASMDAGKNSFRGTGLRQTPDGEILFKRHPLVYARPLDSDTTDPVYGLDMFTFHAMTQRGDNMRLGDFGTAPTQHRVFVAHLDHKHQTICTNRRNNWVINK